MSPLTPLDLPALAQALRASRGFAHKRDIAGVVRHLQGALQLPGLPEAAVPVGDDCAVLPDGQGGHLLFAIEGFVDDFVERMPWFAGYCGVMVNASDIYAMGGRPRAVVDALWSPGPEPARPLLQGLAEAARRYAIPVVGGHSNHLATRGQLAVAILGRAQRLLTSFNARPGDQLLAVVDLRGAYEEPFPYWNASTRAPAERLRADLALLPELAEAGLCDAAKDISMAGLAGTTLMLLECSRAGAVLDLDAVPRPAGVPLLRWLTSFPSYGFVLSVRPAQAEAVRRRFAARDLACAVVGEVQAGSALWLRQQGAQACLWDWAAEAFITAGPVQPEAAHA